MNTKESTIKAKQLLEELLYANPSEQRQVEITCEVESIVSDPDIFEYLFFSNEYSNSNGTFDLDRLVDECFKHIHKPNIIALS